MQDRKALQAGTSHFLGQNFARAFDVTFQTETGAREHVWATSWGVSTRMVGALIMTHGDDRGLVLPPKLAPRQVVVVPIYKNETKSTVLDYADRLTKRLSERYRTVLDDSDTSSPGRKFSEWELRGVPIRVECGPRDVETNSAVLVRRDTGEKLRDLPLDGISERIGELLEAMQREMFQRAEAHRAAHSRDIASFDELQAFFAEGGGFARAPWDGSPQSEQRVKEMTKATIRVLLADDAAGRRCAVSGNPARHIAVFARNY